MFAPCTRAKLTFLKKIHKKSCAVFVFCKPEVLKASLRLFKQSHSVPGESGRGRTCRKEDSFFVLWTYPFIRFIRCSFLLLSFCFYGLLSVLLSFLLVRFSVFYLPICHCLSLCRPTESIYLSIYLSKSIYLPCFLFLCFFLFGVGWSRPWRRGR